MHAPADPAATRRRETLGLLAGAVGIAMFAGSLPATRIAVAHLDPWFVTAARAAIPGLIAACLLAALRRPWPRREERAPLFVTALGIVLGFPVFTALAMETVPASHGAVVLGIMPLVTALFATLIAGERPSRLFWICAAAGAALVVAFTLRAGGAGDFARGDLFLVAAGLSATLGYVLSARMAATRPGWEVISWALVLSLPVSLPATLWLWSPDAARVAAEGWAGLAYVALFPQFVGFFFWNAGLAMGGIARVGQVQLLQPFGTIAIAAAVNREAISPETLLFAAAVVGAVMLGRRAPVAR